MQVYNAVHIIMTQYLPPFCNKEYHKSNMITTIPTVHLSLIFTPLSESSYYAL
jgi:hypothetical protein